MKKNNRTMQSSNAATAEPQNSAVLECRRGKNIWKMTTVNFFMPVNLETGHPAFQQPALWIGRAIITQEVDYDDQDQPFSVDKAEITDLFFLPDAGADVRMARRAELPDSSRAGLAFRYRLEQAAITAYHNPKLQPAEMPDEI